MYAKTLPRPIINDDCIYDWFQFMYLKFKITTFYRKWTIFLEANE